MTASVYQASAPVEAVVTAPQSGGLENSDLLASALARHVNEQFRDAVMVKQEIIQRLLKCDRQRRGVYDPDRMASIAETGGSDIFMNLTGIKCAAAASWIRDVYGQNVRAFDLEPSQEPEIPPEIKLSIVDFVRHEAEGFLAEGQQIHPEAFRERMAEVHDAIMLRVREEGKDTAERMAKVIDDQLEAGNWRRAFDDFIEHYVTYPTAVMKGPTVRKKNRLTWGQGFQPVVVNDYFREVEAVSPYDIFPSRGSIGVDDGSLIQRHRMDIKTIESLKGVPGYSDSEIDQVLARYARSGFRYDENGDIERDVLHGKGNNGLLRGTTIHALEFWGPVMGDMLKAWGMKSVDPKRVYEVNVWVVGPFVIRAVINPDPLGRRPYEIASWRRIPGSFWGSALPEEMADVQVMCNGAARSLANNMAMASGPMTEVQVDRLADGEELTQIRPWIMLQTTSDRTGGGQPAVKFFQPDMKAQELMLVFQSFMRQADEVTGIPNYIYGSGQGASGAGRTASGLSMLMDNAAKGIKSSVINCDRVVEMVVGRFYVHNMMYNPDPYIKGDFRVVMRGAIGLIAKEVVQQRRNEFTQLALTSPVAQQIMGIEGVAYLLRETAKGLDMDTNKLIPSAEMLKFKAEQIQSAMAAQQGTPAGPQAAGLPAPGGDSSQAGAPPAIAPPQQVQQ